MTCRHAEEEAGSFSVWSGDSPLWEGGCEAIRDPSTALRILPLPRWITLITARPFGTRSTLVHPVPTLPSIELCILSLNAGLPESPLGRIPQGLDRRRHHPGGAAGPGDGGGSCRSGGAGAVGVAVIRGEE